jgi:hypothetical protein
MKSVVELEIAAPQARVATLLADPQHAPRWMNDVARYEPLEGTPGLPGSRYRLVPKKGSRTFVATVLTRDLPTAASVRLEAANVTVVVKDTFIALSPTATRLKSEEDFHFRGLLGRLIGFLAQRAIRRAHRRHMLAFKRFAETPLE